MKQVREAAEKNKMNPEKWCTQVSQLFRNLFDLALISYDDYIRTTELRHKQAVSYVWNKLKVRFRLLLIVHIEFFLVINFFNLFSQKKQFILVSIRVGIQFLMKNSFLQCR